ncbi:MAG: hypothetical protein J6X56_06335 [Ruminococcus sp.]|nr:hypothetical protein [Ruminococcus sp.]
MKNVLKKVSAIALAFTLLGSGTAIAKNVNPKSVNTLTASAACQYHHGTVVNGYYINNYRLNESNYNYYKKNGKWYKETEMLCKCCGGHVGWYTQRA